MHNTMIKTRETMGQPSTARITQMRERYLTSPLMIDPEYIQHYTVAHQRNAGQHPLAVRAECHAYALEHLTPVIKEIEPFVGSKTRFVRGAVPYCNYASSYLLRELNHQKYDAQDEVIELGTGGGFAQSAKLADTAAYELFAGKFLLAKKDRAVVQQCAEYWRGKCMQDLGDDLWKNYFAHADYIEKGWRAGLYTAPHDPAPEGRFILDFSQVLTGGLNSIIARINNKLANLVVTDHVTAEKLHYWRATLRVLQATITWAQNYAAEAQRLAALEKDVQRKAELLAIAERCLRVPAQPARDFKEAMQSFWLIYIAGHLEGSHLGYSPGRFDAYMYPFYKEDVERGWITDAEVLEWLEALRVKMTEIEYVASFSWEGLGSGNLFQNMIIGGLDANGRPAANALSLLILQSMINCQMTQPTISIWYDDSLSEAFLLKAIEAVKTGCGFPAWFNFKIYAQHELQKGKVPIALIRTNAAMGGCTEPTMAGMSYGIVQAGFINHLKLLELSLYGGVDPRTDLVFEQTPVPTNYEQLVATYKIHLQSAIRYWQQYWNYVMVAHRQTTNLIFASALTQDCIERGLSLDDGGAVCNHMPTTLSSGLVNVANSLAAVKQLVGSGMCSMEELKLALRNNWQGYEQLHQRVKAAPKWGNNDDRVDQIFVELFNEYCTYVAQQNNYLGEPYDPSMLAISTHVPFGAVCGATPDGRVAGESLCDGVTSPMPGTDRHGPIAVLQSAAKVDHVKIRGGLHNMKFHPTAINGIKGSKALLSLIKTYFDLGGFQLQFNVVDNQMLIEARKHPDKYRDLIVRVAGFSAFFVELSRALQDQIIERTVQEI